MSPERRGEVRIVRFNPQDEAHRTAISDLMDQHFKELRDAVLKQGVTAEAATKAKAIRLAYDKKMTRVTRSLQTGKAYAHIAFIPATDRFGHSTLKPIGFIFSHEDVEHPLGQHHGELKGHFKELAEIPEENLPERILYGEHGYVLEQFQNNKIGKELMEAHEKDALKLKGKKITHRMVSLWSPETKLEEMLMKNGYKRLAVRESGAIILAKKLKPAAGK